MKGTRLRRQSKKAKRRARTNKNVPAKGRLRDIADNLWRVAVRDDWAGKCAVCGRSQGQMEAHHLIPRQHQSTRYLLRNGIYLCRQCHMWDADLAPHENAAGWMVWLTNHQPELHNWYTKMIATRAYRDFAITVNAAYYCDVIKGLKEYVDSDEYVRIVGVRFAKYLETTEPGRGCDASGG